jgi:hypothetical protein
MLSSNCRKKAVYFVKLINLLCEYNEIKSQCLSDKYSAFYLYIAHFVDCSSC